MNGQWTAIVTGVLFLVFMGLVDGVSSAQDGSGGLAVDAALGPFECVKCGGAKSDGVEVGEPVCYRSRNSSRPQVIIFAHQLEQLSLLDELAKSLDARMSSASSLRVFVNVLGADLAATKKKAGEWSEKLGLQQVAVVVPLEHTQGPEAYQLDKDALVTVIVAKRSRVVASRAVRTAADIKSVSESLSKDLDSL